MSAPEPMDASTAFAELAKIRLDQETTESALQRIAELAKAVLPGAAEVSMTMLKPDRQNARTVAFTGDLAMQLDEAQYGQEQGPCLDAAEGGVVLHMRDSAEEARWPAFARAARERGIISSLSVPVPVQPQIMAALNSYAMEPDSFNEESVELAQTFASYAAVALANIALHESVKTLAQQLQTAMESRAVIEQAKGVVMAERRCSAADAFRVLVTLSQETNRKLKDVAQLIVEQVEEL